MKLIQYNLIFHSFILKHFLQSFRVFEKAIEVKDPEITSTISFHYKVKDTMKSKNLKSLYNIFLVPRNIYIFKASQSWGRVEDK